MEEKARNWLNRRFDDYRVTEKVRGTANLNLFVEADRDYVLRVSRDVSKDRLENEFKVLNLLEEEGIENVPKAVEIDRIDGKNILLETCVGAHDLEKISKPILGSLAEKAAEIHAISGERTAEFLDEEEPETDLREILRRDFEKWSEQPYREYREKSDYRSDEMEKFYRKQKEIVENAPEARCGNGLIHGDLGQNIRIDGEQVFIVDWEFGRAGCPGMELLYLFKRHELGEEERKFFLEEYRKHRSLEECFEKLRGIYPKLLAFNDAAWAAKRYARTGEEQYRNLLDRRIESLEEIHGTNDS